MAALLGTESRTRSVAKVTAAIVWILLAALVIIACITVWRFTGATRSQKNTNTNRGYFKGKHVGK